MWGSGSALTPFGWGGPAGSVKVPVCRCRLTPGPCYLCVTAGRCARRSAAGNARYRAPSPASTATVAAVRFARKNAARAAEAARRGVEGAQRVRTLRLRSLLPAPPALPRPASKTARDAQDLCLS